MVICTKPINFFNINKIIFNFKLNEILYTFKIYILN